MSNNPQMGVDIKLQNQTSWFGSFDTDLETTGRGDLCLIEGSDNLRQALIRRLNTPLGELWAHPDYGNGALDILSELIDDNLKALTIDAVSDCIRAEPRAQLIKIDALEYPEQRCVQFEIFYRELGQTRVDNLVWRLNV